MRKKGEEQVKMVFVLSYLYLYFEVLRQNEINSAS